MTTPTVEVHTMKANDLEPAVVDVLGYAPLKEGASQAAIDRRTAALAALSAKLADPTTVVSFILRAADEQWNLVAGAPKVNKTAEVIDAAERTVQYEWAAGDSDTPGRWLYEWEVVKDGRPQTFPGNSYNRVEITADLDGAA